MNCIKLLPGCRLTNFNITVMGKLSFEDTKNAHKQAGEHHHCADALTLSLTGDDTRPVVQFC